MSELLAQEQGERELKQLLDLNEKLYTRQKQTKIQGEKHPKKNIDVAYFKSLFLYSSFIGIIA